MLSTFVPDRPLALASLSEPHMPPLELPNGCEATTIPDHEQSVARPTSLAPARQGASSGSGSMLPFPFALKDTL